MAKAVVTGASSGIGEAFARHLANMGYDLIIIARREERLQALADKLTVDVQVVMADLTQDTDVARVESIIRENDDIAYLVNNAGFGHPGHFAEVDLHHHLGMIHLHLDATVRLTHAVIPQMKANKNGAIINVSSIGGLIPMPGSATYNATKAYLVSFSEALSMELADDGIVVQALCPGFTYTEIWEGAAYQKQSHIPKIAWMSADEVVIISLGAIPKKRYLVTTGILNQLSWRLMRIPLFHYFLKRYTVKNLR